MLKSSGITLKGGTRVLRSQCFDAPLYGTKKAVRQKVESQLLKLNEATEYARSQDVTSEALPWYLSSEAASQARIVFLSAKLEAFSNIG